MTKTSAIAKAKANASVSGAPTAAQIEAFLKEKAEREAAAAKEAAAKKEAEKPAKRVFTDEEKAAYRASIKAEGEALKTTHLYHSATVIGGKKVEKGTVVEIAHVSVTKYGDGLARCFVDGKYEFIGTKHLEVGPSLSDARIAALKAEKEAESSATLYIAGEVMRVTDKSVQLRCSDWFRNSYFPFSMITKTGAMQGQYDIFEVPAWKVRQDNGPAALEVATGKQEALTALVDAYDGEPVKQFG